MRRGAIADAPALIGLRDDRRDVSAEAVRLASDAGILKISFYSTPSILNSREL